MAGFYRNGSDQESRGADTLGRSIMKLSVVISTWNRQAKVLDTLRCLVNQTLPCDDYEIIVVDNGSETPITLQEIDTNIAICLIRFEENQERSVARTIGVEAARGEVLLFSDDDLGMEGDFLVQHLQAQQEWPGAMVIGRILLPPESLGRPGIRFRQQLELDGTPNIKGIVDKDNFGTAANMSINREWYLKLEGFDPQLAGIEDQDFALRHTSAGGKIVYLPEAIAIHYDDWLEFPAFCRRQEFASTLTVALSHRYPERAENQHRWKINGPVQWGKEPLTQTIRKLLKIALGASPGWAGTMMVISILEKLLPHSKGLDRLYKLALGIRIFQGYRAGLSQYGIPLPYLQPKQRLIATDTARQG